MLVIFDNSDRSEGSDRSFEQIDAFDSASFRLFSVTIKLFVFVMHSLPGSVALSPSSDVSFIEAAIICYYNIGCFAEGSIK